MSRKGTYIPERGEAVWITLDSQAGHEQAGGGCAHATQRALCQRAVGDAVEQQGEREQRNQRQGEQAGGSHQGSPKSKITLTDHQSEIDHVGPWHDLRNRPALDKLLSAEPPLPVDQFALHHSHHTAKTLQSQNAEGPEKLAQ